MNRPIFVITAFALIATTIGMVQYEKETLRSFADDVVPTYTVTVPSTINLGETAVITAQDLSLQEWESVRVWLTGTGEEDNAFRLHSDTHELTYSISQNGETIGIGAQVLSATSNDEIQTANLAFSLPEGHPYPGEHQGTVQFTISAADQNRRSVLIPGIGYLNVRAGETAVNVNFYNPEGNPCYFRHELVLKDSGETLWKSDELLSPNMRINQITLAHALEAGTYPAVLKISVLSLENEAELNGSEIGFELRVKEG